MPPRKKNSKSNRRGSTAARKAQPPARRNGGQTASASPSAGRMPPEASGPRAKNPPPGVTSGTTIPPGPAGNLPAAGDRPAPATKLPPGLRPARGSQPGPATANALPGAAAANPLSAAAAANPLPGVVPDGQRISVRSRDTMTAAPPSADAKPATPPAGAPDDLPGWAAKAVEELLIVTYWLDPGEQGDPFSTTVRFSGRRADVTGKPQPGDTFSQDETVEGIVPGSGPVAVTAEVRGINQGEWTATARPVGPVGSRPYRSYPPAGDNPAAAPRVPWPRHVAVSTDPGMTVHTARLLRTRVPGIVRFAYASLVSLGVLVGLGLEALLLSHGHYPLLRPMLYSVLAIVAGVIGGKAWYVAVHRGRKFDGWCIQGFVAGAAVVVAVAAVAGPGIPAGAFLAAATPALLIGMAIGRLGCFWAGCCTGRPTASRWGIWSSDRRLGCRRAPAQLLESLAALVSGVTVLVVVLVLGLPRSGPVAVVGLAAYTLCRQYILGLRAEPRVWRYGRPVTAAVAVIALIAGVVLLARS
jgi:phosphatidylglycerol---prolipoprotein diacylglyceryl transferase